MKIGKTLKNFRTDLWITLLTATILFISNFSCKKGIFENVSGNIILEEEFTSSDRIWLFISIQTVYSKSDLLIFKDEQLFDRFTITRSDTLYEIANLRPNTTYRFRAELNIEEKLNFKSQKIQTTTLNISPKISSWQDFIIGPSYGGRIRDIESINDEVVWAVGRYVYEDVRLNGLKWNGSGWDPIGIPVLIYGSPPDSFFGTGTDLMLVKAFSQNNIWFSEGASFFQYRNQNWLNYSFLFQSMSDPDFGIVRDVSLLNPDNIWATGDNGAIYHYDGFDWYQQNSPTKARMNTITGYQSNDGYQVWIGGKNTFFFKTDKHEWRILMNNTPEVFGLDHAEIRVLRQYDENNLFIAIWGGKQNELYRGYFYRLNPKYPDRKILLGITDYFYTDMTIKCINEIYLVGASGGSITQYDGKKLFLYSTMHESDYLNTVSATQNHIYIGGDRQQSALILKGTK